MNTTTVDTSHGRVVRASMAKVRHEASNGRLVRIGLRVVLTREDGTLEHCEHTHGHRTVEAARTCATRTVAAINRALEG